jgi:hypothetical protein
MRLNKLRITRRSRAWLLAAACAVPAFAALGFAGLGIVAPVKTVAAEAAPVVMPQPPADGVMGFVVSSFYQPVVQDKEACPLGPQPRLRDAYLDTLPAPEKARLLLPENKDEWERRWKAYAFGADRVTNICAQPDLFDRQMDRTVQSPLAWGLDLDNGAEECEHEESTTPAGSVGIDNQEYRALGCLLEWRGAPVGSLSDQQIGIQQFHRSGEWTQVILLKGVDSLENDSEVEVIYANTPDRPMLDSKGNFLRGASFNVSDKLPRHRNVLRGRIDNGVLTTEPADIKLTQSWGQGGARDIRGNRTMYHYQRGRLRLTFQPDGSLKGFLGGYRPVLDPIYGTTLGGAGSAIVAGRDCSAELNTLKRFADGIKDPRTGKCTAVSSAQQLSAIPAFVIDLPSARTARGSRR